MKTTVVRSAYATLSQLTWWSLAESLKKFDEKSASGWLAGWAEKCLETDAQHSADKKSCENVKNRSCRHFS